MQTWDIIALLALAVVLIVQFLTRNIHNSFITRTISGGVLLLAALLTIINGGWILFFTTLILSLIGLRELDKAIGVVEENTRTGPLEASAMAGVVLYYASLHLFYGRLQVLALILGLVLLMFVYVFTYPRYRYPQVMGAFFGILYCGVMLSFVYQTRMLDTGRYLVWLTFIASWGCDTCAYCAGRVFGKHKMAPVLSPKKTIEGAVGGIAGAMLLGLLYASLTRGPRLEYVAICLFGALVSMIGDLAASAIKRNAGIKDYGKLIPGHGGVMDRFDSVIFTAPVIYLLGVTIL